MHLQMYNYANYARSSCFEPTCNLKRTHFGLKLYMSDHFSGLLSVFADKSPSTMRVYLNW